MRANGSVTGSAHTYNSLRCLGMCVRGRGEKREETEGSELRQKRTVLRTKFFPGLDAEVLTGSF